MALWCNGRNPIDLGTAVVVREQLNTAYRAYRALARSDDQLSDALWPDGLAVSRMRGQHLLLCNVTVLGVKYMKSKCQCQVI
jgi:hypothetical protein